MPRLQLSRGTRRAALTAGLGLTAAAAISARPAQASTRDAAFQSVVVNGADPTGGTDASAAFAAAYMKLPEAGGTIYCPGGQYLLAKPVVFEGKPVQLIGDGSAATVLLMKHTGTCITYISTITGVLAARLPFQMRGIAIGGPTAGGAAKGGVAVMFGASSVETGYQSCAIDDVAIGNALVNQPNGANIAVGLYLQNIWKSAITNVRHFGAAQCFVQLVATAGGLCIDNTFLNCFMDGTGYGFLLQSQGSNASPIQGLNIISPKLLCTTALASNYATSNNISVLGLFLTGGTIACSAQAMDLHNVWTGYISECSVSTSSQSAASVIGMEGCEAVSIADCQVSGAYNNNTGAGSGTWGIAVGGVLNRLTGISLSNLLNGVLFSPGATSNLATGLQLVDAASFPLLQSGPAAVDKSGLLLLGRNNAQWLNQTGNLVTLY